MAQALVFGLFNRLQRGLGITRPNERQGQIVAGHNVHRITRKLFAGFLDQLLGPAERGDKIIGPVYLCAPARLHGVLDLLG